MGQFPWGKTGAACSGRSKARPGCCEATGDRRAVAHREACYVGGNQDTAGEHELEPPSVPLSSANCYGQLGDG